MSSLEPYACPLCSDAPLEARGTMLYACPVHGRFELVGEPAAAGDAVTVRLQHVATGLRYPLDVCSAAEWTRRTTEGR